MITDERAG